MENEERHKGKVDKILSWGTGSNNPGDGNNGALTGDVATVARCVANRQVSILAEGLPENEFPLSDQIKRPNGIHKTECGTWVLLSAPRAALYAICAVWTIVMSHSVFLCECHLPG